MNDPVEDLRKRLGIPDEPRKSAAVVPQRMTLDAFQSHAEQHAEHLRQLFEAEKKERGRGPLIDLMRRLGRA